MDGPRQMPASGGEPVTRAKSSCDASDVTVLADVRTGLRVSGQSVFTTGSASRLSLRDTRQSHCLYVLRTGSHIDTVRDCRSSGNGQALYILTFLRQDGICAVGTGQFLPKFAGYQSARCPAPTVRGGKLDPYHHIPSCPYSGAMPPLFNPNSRQPYAPSSPPPSTTSLLLQPTGHGQPGLAPQSPLSIRSRRSSNSIVSVLFLGLSCETHAFSGFGAGPSLHI